MFLSRLCLVSRSVAPQRVVATARARAANILPRISTSTLLTSRSFCADVHDDFKPKRRAYSPDENVHAQIAKDIAENKVCKLDRVLCYVCDFTCSLGLWSLPDSYALLWTHQVTVFMKGVPEAPMCGFSNTVRALLKLLLKVIADC